MNQEEFKKFGNISQEVVYIKIQRKFRFPIWVLAELLGCSRWSCYRKIKKYTAQKTDDFK